MFKSNTFFIGILAVILAIYYLVCGVYLNNLGYYNHESLFYIEKSRIVFEGLGNRLKVMGLTSPMIPFYATFLFTFNKLLAPVLASCIGTAILFFMMASAASSRLKDDVYVFILLALFLFHPGMLYAACSGKSIYLILVFFYLFFFNLIKFYRSNTTFHVSIASICLVTLIFCDYKFIWLTLFFLPLVLAITVHSLNLGEQESIFRLFLSFNSPSLRRKLINKTVSLYIILFALPLASILCYKLLNLTHASDLNYFNESPYATWNVLIDKLSVEQQTSNLGTYGIPELSLLLSARVLLFCPMIVIAIYLFRESTYQVLTILTPFALIEFLHIKYDKVFLVYQYYLIFIILAFLCVIMKAKTIKNQQAFKILLCVVAALQLYFGWYYFVNSSVAEERNFVKVLTEREEDETNAGNVEVAEYLSSLPSNSRILVDDAIGYPIVAFANDIKPLVLPYQSDFLSALELPDKSVEYLVIATAKNPVAGYTQLNNKYIPTIKQSAPLIEFRKVFETTEWIVYRIVGTREY